MPKVVSIHRTELFDNSRNVFYGSELFAIMFENMRLWHKTRNEEASNVFEKLRDIANAGDWELALEIAKGQGLI